MVSLATIVNESRDFFGGLSIVMLGSELMRQLGPLVIVVNELLGCYIPDCAVRPLLIVFPSPGFNHQLFFWQGQKPVLV